MTRRYHLHLPGLLYLGLTALVGLAAFSQQNNLLFWFLGVMVSAVVISGVVSGTMMMGMRVQRLVPRHAVVGEPCTVRYAITNRNRLVPIFNVHVEEQPVAGPGGWSSFMKPARAWIMHIGPRETVHGEALFWPEHRGEARFGGVRLWTTFPFGIVRKSVTFSRPQHTLVHPLLYEVRRNLIETVGARGFTGATLSAKPPDPLAGDDYYGLREFRPGDSLRHVAWKQTAARDTLLCIDRTRPAPPRVRVILDLRAPTPSLRVEPNEPHSARQLEERAISLAASIIQDADARGFEVGLTVAGSPLPRLPIRRGHWHREKMMAALAAIDLDAKRHDSPPRDPDAERTGQIVIHPDRVDPSAGRDDALHLSARRLEDLVVRSLGWGPGSGAAAAAPPPPAPRAEVTP